MTEPHTPPRSADPLRELLQAIREDASAYQWHLVIDKALAAASAPPRSPDSEQLQHASDFIRAMLDAVGLQGSDRAHWQAGSWVSLKELALQVVGLIEDLKVNGASPASPPRAWQPMNRTEIRCSKCGAWSDYPTVSCSQCGEEFSFSTLPTTQTEDR